MSGLEVAAGVAGFISVSTVALEGCLKAFSLIDNAQHLGRDADRIRVKIKWEQYRLFQWSERIGLEGAGVPSPRANWALVNEILKQLESLLTDTKKLTERYGLAIDEASQYSSVQIQSSETGIGRLLSRLKPEFYLASARAIQDQNGAIERLKWTLRDGDKASKLAEEIKRYNDYLYEFLELADRDFTRSSLEALLRDLVSHATNSSDLETVKQLLNPLVALDSEAPSVAAAASLKQIRLILGLDKTSDELVGIVTPSTPVLKVTRLKSKYFEHAPAAQFSSNRELAVYKSRQVLIEWKRIDPVNEQRLKSRVEGLALLLGQVRHSSFHSLPCLGFSKDDKTKNYAFVFDLEDSELNPVPSMPIMVRELSQLLEETRLPSLNERFRIALALSETLLQLHTTGWLHKGVSSRNVLFLEAGQWGWSNESAKGPYLAGYEHARVDSPGEMTETTTGSFDSEIYYHPHLFNYPRPPFTKQFDLFALGCVLIEIALWTRVEVLFSEKETKGYGQTAGMMALLEQKENNQVMQKVAFYAGDSFRNVILMCLTALDNSNRDESLGEGSVTIQKSVVETLKSCRC